MMGESHIMLSWEGIVWEIYFLCITILFRVRYAMEKRATLETLEVKLKPTHTKHICLVGSKLKLVASE